MERYNCIKNNDDVKLFIKNTNGLHDGYIVGFEYVNNGIEARNGCISVCSEKSELKIQVLITSLEENPTVEIVFKGISDWKIRNGTSNVFGSTIGFDEGAVIWADSPSIEREVIRENSFVKASAMYWRFL